MTTTPEIRSRLRARRSALGLSQQQLADLLGTTQSAVSDLENGRADPLVGTVRRWAQALGMRITIGLEDLRGEP